MWHRGQRGVVAFASDNGLVIPASGSDHSRAAVPAAAGRLGRARIILYARSINDVLIYVTIHNEIVTTVRLSVVECFETIGSLI
jgi:hypothetical protein